MEGLLNYINNQAHQKNIKNLDNMKYILNVWIMYIGADMAQRGSIDLESQMRKCGFYSHEMKKDIEIVKKRTTNLVSDVDKNCDHDFACSFGDLADEAYELLTDLLQRRHKAITDIINKQKSTDEESGLCKTGDTE